MPQITIHVGGREPLEPAISKATPMGALPTEAIVHVGPTMLAGSATALRALADALVEAATWPTPTTPTPTPTTSASRPSATPPGDVALRRPGNRAVPTNPGRAAAAQRAPGPPTPAERGP